MKKKALFVLLCFAAMSLASAEARAYLKGMYGAGFRTRDWGAAASSDGSTTELGNVYAALV